MNPERPGSASSDPGRLPWKRIAICLVASRLFIYLLASLSVQIVSPGPAAGLNDPLDLFLHWDANWYLKIAKNGYGWADDHNSQFSPAFFPLYPLAVHFVGFICRDLRVAGYLVSNVCLYGSCLLLWRVVAKEERRSDVADRAVIFLLFGPVSFFFSCVYSDSLFLLLMLGTVHFSIGRRWFAAGALGFLAALTRPVGVLLVIVIACEFLDPYLRRDQHEEERPSWPARDALPFLASLTLTVMGLGVYCLYLAAKLGDPLAFLHAQAHWHRELSTPWGSILHFEYGLFYEVWFRGAVALALITLLTGIFAGMRTSLSVLCCVYVALYLSTLHLESIPRFLSVLFPFYFTIARQAVRFPWLEPLLLAGSAMLLGLSTILFVNGYWFT